MPMDSLAAAFTFYALAIAGLVFGYRGLSRSRFISSLPTSRANGVTLGLNKLKGRATTGSPLRSPLTSQDVVYYRYSIKEQCLKSTTRDGETDSERRWRTIASGSDRVPFAVEDETGSIRVRPREAEFHASHSFSKTCRRDDPLYFGKGPRSAVHGSTGRRKFFEEVVARDEGVVVLGPTRVRDDAVEAEIAHDGHNSLFIISSKPEGALVSRYRAHAVSGFASSVLLAMAGALVYTMVRHDLGPGDALARRAVAVIASGGAVLAAVSSMYLVTVYNGLVELKHRVERARAMLDVELRRRHDLIPRLRTLVEAAVTNEVEVLDGISMGPSLDPGSLRRTAAAADAQTRALTRALGLAEGDPEVRAGANYRALLEEVGHCESRLLLGRSFFNDSVDQLDRRARSFPDRLVAAVARIPSVEPLQFDTLEWEADAP